MSTIIQFPYDKKTRLRIENQIQISKREKQAKTEPPNPMVRIHSDIRDNLADLNDTVKYVTDGLYSIAVELKDIRELLKLVIWILVFWLFLRAL